MAKESRPPKQQPADRPALDPQKVLPPVTEKQMKCLEFILAFFREHRYYPTHREIAEAMGVRSNTAEMYVQPLELKGYLTREPNKQRNVRLTQDALERLELLGVSVHAGGTRRKRAS